MTAFRLVGVPHVLAASLCAGLAAANAVRVDAWTALVIALAAATAALTLGPRGRLALLAAALASTGTGWASARLDALDRSVLAARVGEIAPAEVVVTGPVRRGTFALRAPAEVRRFGRLLVREPVLLELPRGRSPPQGARLELALRLKRPREREGRFDEGAWLARRGVHVVAVAATRWRVVGRRGGVAGAADRLRLAIAANVAPGVGGARRAVIAGVVLGEDEALPAELRDAFRASGLYHLLAVSGQNVFFITFGAMALAWLLRLPRWLAELAVIAAIAAYVLAVGWQPSVVRAGVAGCLASLAWLLARPRDRWHFFLVGAIVLLAWNPYTLLEPGFQLSFAAVAAIFLLVPPLERRLAGYPVPRPLAVVVAVSAACGLVTAPILWLHFGAVPLFTVVSNAAAAPVVGPLLGLGLVTAAVAPVLPSAAVALAWVNGWLAAYLSACATVVAALPFAQVSSGAALLAVAGAPAIIVARRRVPPAHRLRAAVAAGAIVLFGVAWKLAPDGAVPPPSGLRITFLDVGQGDAVLVQTANAALLVDQGPPDAEVASQLRRLGVRRLALLVLTHPQRDHIGGAAEVIDRIAVDRILDPRLPVASADERAALAAARRRRVPIDVARAGMEYRVGRLRVRVLWPRAPSPPGDDPNRHAVVVLVSYGAVDALLPADAESDVTYPLRPPPAEILKVAHHGSADDRLPDLLALTRPRVAVISVGEENDYGHPAPSTLAALADAPALAVYRTDRDGRVVVESDGRRIAVATGR
ncbi:MAG: DNA internalization-related competence protein ComEC/Rec2 [Thermoleophilia bacterium]|nr:DNA internalization-related competence protein ComEC/Rec2 [Thermoleophilia bacterium]